MTAFGPFFFGTEDEMREHMDKVEMAHDEYAHALESIWNNLSNDDLATLGKFFHDLAISGHSDLTLAMTAGRLLQMRASRMNTCVVDGIDHDAQLAGMSGQAVPEEPTEDLPTEPPVVDEERVNRARQMHENMQTYRLHWRETPDGTPQLACKDCDYPYPSLADRMLKPPDDCPGCLHRSKWG